MNIIKKSLKPIYHWLIRLSKWKRRIGLHCTDFTIISNNCSAGYVYQYYGIPYKTPTEGIGFSVDDYLKIVRNPKHYFSHKLEFVSPETTDRYKNGEHFTYPAARIDDIIVYFRHYPTIEEAEEKWKRRCSRMNFKKLFFLLTESETMREEHLEEFSNIIKQSSIRGILLTKKDTTISNVKTIRNVPVEKGIIMWKPEIIINSINWKSILNKL